MGTHDLLDQLIADVATGSLVTAVATKTAAPRTPTAAKPAVAHAKAELSKNKPATARTTPAAPAPAAPAPAAPAPVTPAAGGADDDLPPTTALYQTDTYLFECDANVLGVKELENGAGWAVALDVTCFHPQGGGQPADSGAISGGSSDDAFAVAMVRKDKRGVVWHEGPSKPNLEAGASVHCQVDEAPRRMNARVHSAGHLIDVAMANSGCTLRATKGYHFTPGAYVEYEGKLDAAERDALLPKVQASMVELIGQAIPTLVKDIDAQKLDEACPPASLPADKALWGSGWVRVVCVGGVGCPCGGTHIKDTAELGGVKIEAIKTKGKVTRVSYTMQAEG